MELLLYSSSSTAVCIATSLAKVRCSGSFGVFVYLDFYYYRNNVENNSKEKMIFSPMIRYCLFRFALVY